VTSHIKTLDDLHGYLHAAMQLEHATIPPYLMALYTIHPGTNSDAYHVIRVVVVEEMLHLTLAANLLNAVGGKPDLTRAGFVPQYPTALPDGETDFKVDVQRFSRAAVETFLKIERPGKAPHEEARVRRKPRGPHTRLAAATHADGEMHFYSIGEFYEEIRRGIASLHAQAVEAGKTLFVGDPRRQAGPEYYYSGGGTLIAVTDLETATEAIRLISEQGEGLGGRIFDTEKELAHYYRFQQLLLGRYYQAGDTHDHPTGPPLKVDWDAAYPVKTNARLDDYPEGSELRAAAVEFNEFYGDFLTLLTEAYTGQPNLLLEAVPYMFRIRDKLVRLIHNPIPGVEGVNAAPTFDINPVAARVGL
jgi:hypothetical protein